MKLDLSSFSFVELKKTDFTRLKPQANFNLLSAVVSSSHWKQQHIHAKRFGESEGDWDRATFTGHIWNFVVNSLRRLDRSLVIPVLDICDPRLTTVFEVDAKLVL